MATDLGELKYTLTLNDSGLTSGLDSAKAQVSEASEQMSSHLKNIDESSSGAGMSFGKMTAAFATGQLVAQTVIGGLQRIRGGISSIVSAANDNQAAMSQMAGVIKSTGDASGISAQQQEALANSISSITPTTRDAVMAGENMLSTFTAIKGQAFDQATAAANNMATFFNQGATPSMQQVSQQAMMIGKALNDPATGFSKLQREGVSFNQTQIDTIKQMSAAGNVAGAQAVMLQELQKEFGNAGTAAATTFQGGLQMAENSLDELKISAGEAFENEFAGVFQKLVPVIQSLEPVIESLGGAFAQIADAIIAILPDVIDIIKILAQVITALLPAIVPIIVIVAQFIDQLAKLLLPILNALTPIFPIMASLMQNIADVIGDIMRALAPFIEGGLKILVAVFKALEPAIEVVLNAFDKGLMAIFKALQPAMPAISMALVAIANAFASIIVALSPLLPLLGTLIAQIITAFVPFLPAFAKLLQELLPAFVQLVPPLVQLITLLLPPLIGLLTFLIPIIQTTSVIITSVLVFAIRVLSDALRDVINWINNAISWIKNMSSDILRAVSGFGSLLYDAGKDLIKGLENGVKDAAGAVVDAVKGVAHKAVSALKSVLKIFSPSQIFSDLGTNISVGLAQGITKASDQPVNATTQMASDVINAGITTPPNNTNNMNSGNTYNFGQGSVVLSTADAVNAFFNIGNRSTQLELMGGSPLAGTAQV